ncbi:MAG: hypothetical protein Q3M30_03545 [Candidatus Electrothrix sp. Rat3]|nr:hypothetical protein [Candidatus Electrothrix rattekaaiensis]
MKTEFPAIKIKTFPLPVLKAMKKATNEVPVGETGKKSVGKKGVE